MRGGLAIVGRLCETPSLTMASDTDALQINSRPGALLLLAFARPVIFLGGFECFLEADHVFAGAKVVERFGFALELFLGIIRGLDRETDPALDLVHLDDTGFHFLADLE